MMCLYGRVHPLPDHDDCLICQELSVRWIPSAYIIHSFIFNNKPAQVSGRCGNKTQIERTVQVIVFPEIGYGGHLIACAPGATC